jgi:hypothetical protein
VNLSNNFQCYQTSKNVKTLLMIFLSDNLIVQEKKKIYIFPAYLPIGHIAESERGNKQYFNLGPI